MKPFVLFLHRWLGVALCAVFVVWFSSGIGMMYWGFPDVDDEDRLERSPALDPSTISLSPVEAYARLSLGEPALPPLLNTFDGRPVYRFRTGRGEVIVYADTGDLHGRTTRAMLDRTAARWTGQSVEGALVERIDQVDQWTVQGELQNGPLRKYSWPNGEQVYVAERTGEVVQYTTTASRIGAYLGPIPHWLYFTPLRKHGAQWSRVVIWSSGAGAVVAVLGVLVGVWMYSPSRRYRYRSAPTSIPYHGPKRWHMALGLVFGVATVTWAFSGMLSMDPFPPSRSSSDGESPRHPGHDIPQALRGSADIDAFAAKDPREALRQAQGIAVKELEFTSFADEPVYLARLGRGGTHVIPVNGEPVAAFDHQRIIKVVKRTAQPNGLADVRVIDQYDRYYLDRRRERPLPVILAKLNDAGETRYYIDPRTATVVDTYSADDWSQRWLYHGLHSLNFPWLYNYRPLWDIVVIAFMLGGMALSITSLVLAWRVVMRRLFSPLASET